MRRARILVLVLAAGCAVEASAAGSLDAAAGLELGTDHHRSDAGSAGESAGRLLAPRGQKTIEGKADAEITNEDAGLDAGRELKNPENFDGGIRADSAALPEPDAGCDAPNACGACGALVCPVGFEDFGSCEPLDVCTPGGSCPVGCTGPWVPGARDVFRCTEDGRAIYCSQCRCGP